MMAESFVILLLTVNLAGLDNIQVLPGAHAGFQRCEAYRKRVAKKHDGKLACVSREEFRRKRDEVFR